MPLDQVENFVEVNVAGSHNDSETTISLQSGEASTLPDPSNGEYNLVWFNSTNFSRPSDDDDVEIVRVTGRDTNNDTITVQRGQENTSAVAHDTSNSDYVMILAQTAKMIEDVDAANFETNSVTVAGNSVTLGQSTPINHGDLSNINASDHHTRYSDEESQDAFGSMLSGQQSLINVTYDDANNEVDFVVQEADIDHDSLTGFVSNEHINHSNVNIVAGTHLTGGGDLTSSRTLNVDETGISVTDLDGSSGSSGQFLQTDGSNLSFADVSAGGKFEDALANGKVLADDGNLYDSIQTAENNATDYIFIGPGTFNENVTVDTDNLTIIGTGTGTVIDGGSGGEALLVQSSDVTVKSLKARTTQGSGSNADAITYISGFGRVVNCEVDESDAGAISVRQGLVTGCTVEGSINAFGIEAVFGRAIISGNRILAGNTGISVRTRGVTVESNIISGVSGRGIDSSSYDLIITGNRITDTGSDGVGLSGDDVLLGGNVILNSADDGIRIVGADNIVYNNRIKGSTNSDLNTSFATNPELDSNLTGDPN